MQYRQLFPGIGEAVFERTYGRRKKSGKFETWGEVAQRVALGNSLLCETKEEQESEFKLLKGHIAHESVRDALHKYGPESKNVKWFKVPDTREGWAQALELWENAAFEKIHKDKTLILDFSDVREKGQMIGGMQGRPASGPVPLMNA